MTENGLMTGEYNPLLQPNYSLTGQRSTLVSLISNDEKLSDSITLDLASCGYFQTTQLLKECRHIPSH